MFNIPTQRLAKVTVTEVTSAVTLSVNPIVIAALSFTPRHLVVRVNGKTDRTGNSRDEVNVKFNGDTGTNYNYQALYGYDSSSEAARYSGVAGLNVGWIATDNTASTVFGSLEALVPDALSTRTHKSVAAFVGAAEDGVVISAGRWASTAAITSVTMSPVTGTNFNAGSTFELCVVDESFNIDQAGDGEQILGTAGTFSVGSIGAADGDLVVIGNVRTDRPASATNDECELEFNGDTAANYVVQVLEGDNTSALASTSSLPYMGRCTAASADANAFGGLVAQVTNFSDGSNDRVYNALAGYHGTSSSSEVRVYSGRWNNTAAITSLAVHPSVGSNFITGSMLSTYAVPKNLIERQELGSDAATITFADIPQTYDHLELSIYARTDTAADTSVVDIKFNADATAANYDVQRLIGTSSTAAAAQSAASQRSGTVPAASSTANIFGSITQTFYNYTKTDRHKHSLFVSGHTGNQPAVELYSQRWENTSAITSIALTGTGDFIAGSVFTLRGIHSTAPATASDVAALNGIAPADITAVN